MTQDIAASLVGKPWLIESRIKAAAAFANAEFPTESEEDWRYSRITDLKLDEFSLSDLSAEQVGSSKMSDAAQQFVDAVGHAGAVVRTLNGSIASIETVSTASQGVTLEHLNELPSAPAIVDATRSRRSDPFAQLSAAYFSDALVIDIPAGVQVDEPIVVIHEVVADNSPVVVFPQVFIAVGDGASASLIEFFCSDDNVSLVVPTTAMELGDGATLSYQSVQRLGTKTWQIGTQLSKVSRDANFRSFATALGGEYARTSIDSQLAGENSESQLLAVYFGDDNQVQDFRTFQQHSAPHSKSELIFKGADSGFSRSVYTGLIQIDRGAVKSDASQTNRNLVLSEGAHADSVPNLDINENDVRCTHASAVGPIDPEQRFYLETRGVPSEIAEQLILLGFFNDLFDRALSKSITAYLKQAVADRLLSVSMNGDDDMSGRKSAEAR